MDNLFPLDYVLVHLSEKDQPLWIFGMPWDEWFCLYSEAHTPIEFTKSTWLKEMTIAPANANVIQIQHEINWA